mmetsp:Transcript_13146/g.23248  ORF Transcript_13146/g.23248 Transcript_13146/m.23248 type:complete len:224 (+) Transcript_13146:1424-2095(+)
MNLLHGFHHDRKRVPVWTDIGGLHLVNHIPSLIEVSVAHGGVEDAVVGDIIGRQALALHLHQYSLASFEITLGAEALEKCVVCDDVKKAQLLHFPHKLFRPGHVASLDANIDDTVIGGSISDHATLPELLDDSESTVHVTIATGGSDERHVVLDVHVGDLVCERLGKLGASALDCKLHEAAVHHGIWFESVLLDLRVKVASLVVHARVGIDLHESTVESDAHA